MRYSLTRQPVRSSIFCNITRRGGICFSMRSRSMSSFQFMALTRFCITAGWVPVNLAIGISVAIRHDDWVTQRQSSWGAGNTEVLGYTELVTHVRHEARERFDEAIRAAEADGGIVSDMGLYVWEIEPSEGHRDHVAESTVVGTAVARYHAGSAAPSRSMTILPLRDRSSRRTGR